MTDALPTVTASLTAGTTVRLAAREHTWSGDEPAEKGGADEGATPYEQLLGALATCTAITLRMYAQHKGMDLASVEITSRFSRELAKDCPEHELDDDTKLDVIRSDVVLQGTFDDAQRERLTQVAGRCPVHKTLDGGPFMVERVRFEPA